MEKKGGGMPASFPGHEGTALRHNKVGTGEEILNFRQQKK